MDLKYKFLLVSLALNVIWISTLIIDFDLQSWTPRAVLSLSSADDNITYTTRTNVNRFTLGRPPSSTAQPVPTTSSVPQPSSSQYATPPSTTILPTTKLPTTKLPSTKVSTTNVPTTKTPITTKLPTTKVPTTKTPVTTKFPTTKPPTTKTPVTTKLATTKVPTTKTPITTKLPTIKVPTTIPKTTKVPTTTKVVSITKVPTTQLHTTKVPAVTQSSSTTTAGNSSYILDLPGCKMKYYQPFDAEVKSYYSKQTDLKCGESYIFATGTELKIDKAAMAKGLKLEESEIICELYEIFREGEGKSDNQYGTKFIQNITSEKYTATKEFLEIKCLTNDTIVYDDLFAFIHPKEKVEQRCENATKYSATNDKRKEKFNFVAVNLDSVSHRNFLRHFPKTYAELSSNFDLIEFNGYTKVGLNTFPCLLPLVVGKSETELKPGKGPFDNLPFIWKKFSSLGYRTLFGEDSPGIAMFHYLKRGFYYPPTDYYLRPYYKAVGDSQMRKLSKDKCFNARREISVPLKWCQDFLTEFRDKPIFSLTLMSHLTHDYLNDAGYGDDPLWEFVTWYRNSAVRNNTFLLLFSDHGIRWGGFRGTDMGAQEDSLPFLFLVAPPWFKKKYPVFDKNLKLNQNRLVTMFDVHEMLKDILNFTGEPRTIKPTFHERGISLFEEIPGERTCDDADIGPEYCVCHIRKHIDVNSSRAIAAAKILVKAINNETESERNKCEVLVLQSVKSARHFTINKRFEQKELKTLDSFKLTVAAIPGEGLFEGVVLCEHSNPSVCASAGVIDRINKYGNQSICIKNSITRNYCYCTELLNTITTKS